MSTGSFPWVKSGRGVSLTPHPLLVPWSRKSRAIRLLHLWAERPVQSLSACTRVHFNFCIYTHTHTHMFSVNIYWVTVLRDQKGLGCATVAYFSHGTNWWGCNKKGLLSKCHFVHHNCHMDCSGNVPARPLWEAGDFPLEPWCGLPRVKLVSLIIIISNLSNDRSKASC